MRSPRKAASQLEALGGAPRALKGEAFNLVVCATPNLEDGWIFSDFLGFSSVLRELPGNHTFYSCFDLAGHFASVKQHKDIKFGKYGPEKKHIFSYEKSRFEQCPPFWQQFATDKLLDAYHAWVEESKKKARLNDVVNIVFVGHGTPDGYLQFGKRFLHSRDLVKRIQDFPEGVQLNIIATSCFGGHIADGLAKTQQTNRYVAACEKGSESRAMARSPSGRWRTGRFANAFVESLLKAVADFRSPSDITWTVEQHDKHIEFRLRNLTPREPILRAQFHHMGFQPENMPLQNLLLRDNTDEGEEQEFIPKEIDWKVANELVNETLTRTIATSDHSVTPSAMALAQTEGELCNIDKGEPSEMLIYDQLFYPNTNWKLVLTNMYWRSFRQAAMWNVFLKLLQKGLVNTTCLEIPVNLHNVSRQSSHVSCLIGCFEVIATHSNDSMMGNIPGQNVQWTKDTNWYVPTYSQRT